MNRTRSSFAAVISGRSRAIGGAGGLDGGEASIDFVFSARGGAGVAGFATGSRSPPQATKSSKTISARATSPQTEHAPHQPGQ